MYCFCKPGFGAGTPKEAGLFRSPNSLFELNAGDFLLRGSAKFSVWRISRSHRFWGEQRKIRVSTFRKRRKMPPILCQIRTVPCPQFGFDEICTCIYHKSRVFGLVAALFRMKSDRISPTAQQFSSKIIIHKIKQRAPKHHRCIIVNLWSNFPFFAGMNCIPILASKLRKMITFLADKIFLTCNIE